MCARQALPLTLFPVVSTMMQPPPPGVISSLWAPLYFLNPLNTLKARTHRLICRGFAADSIPELADSTTDFTNVSRLFLSNMFDMLLQIGLVGMGLKPVCQPV